MEANTLRLLVLSAFLGGGIDWANGGGNDPYSAERYYSSPQKFVGEKVKIRLFKIEPRPSLTARDLGYVWFQGTTDREGSEVFKIHLRVEQEEAEKFARNFQTENRMGRLTEGVFESRSATSDLPTEVATQVAFFLTLGERAAVRAATGEVISGSLVVTPSPKKADKTEKIPLVAVPVSEPETAVFSDSKLILVRSGGVTSLQLREAAKVKTKADVVEVLGQDGSLQSVIGRSSVLAVLPAPTSEVSPEKAAQAVELFDQVIERHPEAKLLLAEAHRRWKEIAATAMVTASR